MDESLSIVSSSTTLHIYTFIFLSLSYSPFSCITDAEEEWKDYKSLSDSVLHIDLRNWADIRSFHVIAVGVHASP